MNIRQRTQVLAHGLEEQLICGVCEALQLDVADLRGFIECWWYCFSLKALLL